MDKKTVFITGATRGIGRSIAIEFAKEGYNICFTFRNEEDKDKLHDKLKEIIITNDFDTEILALKGDIRDYDTCEKMLKEATDFFDTIEVLINNAGITRDNIAIRMKNEDFKEVIDVNLTASFYLMKLFGKHMMRNKYGKIISISSIVGLHGNAGQINYAASKAGINAMTKTLARELAGRNINVNAIAPGFVETDMTDRLKDDIKDFAMSQIPLKRFASTIDIANLTLFLASDKASYITGQIISVDGGMNI